MVALRPLALDAIGNMSLSGENVSEPYSLRFNLGKVRVAVFPKRNAKLDTDFQPWTMLSSSIELQQGGKCSTTAVA